jgi:crotonobetainyl-CoA:carnitine CoA-transferase CaiB-like acyl-CoA transferase
MLESLSGLIDLDRHAVRVRGPRTWWGGPLNVEELALGSVECALSALAATGGGTTKVVNAELVAGNFESIGRLRVGGRPAEMFASMSGYFRCADGWIRTHANFPHHANALRTALGAVDRDGVSAALAERPAIEAEELIHAAGGVAGALRTRAEWEAGEPGAAVASQPWIRFRAGEPVGPVQLEGARVLDFTRVLAGPTATKFLAWGGADVLRIDPPHIPELRDQYLDTGAGKRSAIADLRERDVLREVLELAGAADVVVLGYRPGALEKVGLAPEDLHAAHPHLAVVHLDAWGDTGPWATRRGFDSVVQAPMGIADLYRRSDGTPGALPVPALDYATGYGAAAAALALLGRGGIAHLSLARTAHELIGLSPPRGPCAALDVPLCEVDGPSGRLQQVEPLLGPPRAPGVYGQSPLGWSARHT